jgi:hypothetical protein
VPSRPLADCPGRRKPQVLPVPAARQPELPAPRQPEVPLPLHCRQWTPAPPGPAPGPLASSLRCRHFHWACMWTRILPLPAGEQQGCPSWCTSTGRSIAEPASPGWSGAFPNGARSPTTGGVTRARDHPVWTIPAEHAPAERAPAERAPAVPRPLGGTVFQCQRPPRAVRPSRLI